MTTIIEYINPLLKGKDLSFDQANSLLDLVFEGEVPEPQIAAFLTAMQIKGLNASEVAGLAQSMRTHAVKVQTGLDNIIDIVGTGGAAVKTFNVSTASAIVCAGTGAHIAKHGNRAITSKCGSADVLEELGVNINPGPEIVAECVKEANVGFMFAPMYHPAMKYVQPIRKSLGFRTVFNILGPLTNPAGVNSIVLGVAEESLMQMMAEVLNILGTKFTLVVHSDGLDEISLTGITKICELKDGHITEKQMNPADLGMNTASIEQMSVTDAKTSAKVIMDILSGKETGPCKDIILLNSAAGVIAAGLADDFSSAVELAQKSISDGKAMNCLEKLIEISNKA